MQSPQSHSVPLKTILISLSHLSLYIPSGIFPSQKSVCISHVSHIYHTFLISCSPHCDHHNKEEKGVNPYYANFSIILYTSSTLRQRILATLVSFKHSLCYSQSVWHQISHLCRTELKLYFFFFILTFMFFKQKRRRQNILN
jgi:hypothetical protein